MSQSEGVGERTAASLPDSSQLQDALALLLKSDSEAMAQGDDEAVGDTPSSPPVFHGGGLSWVKPGTLQPFSLDESS